LLVAVTLDAPSDWADHQKLLDMGFSSYESRLIAEPMALSLPLPLLNMPGKVTVSNAEELRLAMKRGEDDPERTLDLLPLPLAPIKKGAVAGAVTYKAKDGRTVSSPLIFMEDIPLTKAKKGRFGLGR
jgi:D-alanyl-D-alanine carboxypeptidase